MIEIQLIIKPETKKTLFMTLDEFDNSDVMYNNVKNQKSTLGGFNLSGLEIVILISSVANIIRFILDLQKRLKDNEVVKVVTKKSKTIVITKNKTTTETTKEVTEIYGNK